MHEFDETINWSYEPWIPGETLICVFLVIIGITLSAAALMIMATLYPAVAIVWMREVQPRREGESWRLWKAFAFTSLWGVAWAGFAALAHSKGWASAEVLATVSYAAGLANDVRLIFQNRM